MSVIWNLSFRGDSKEIIGEALLETRKRILDYYDAQKKGKTNIIVGILESEKIEIINKIDGVAKGIIKNEKTFHQVYKHELDYISEIIGNCLMVYYTILKEQVINNNTSSTIDDYIEKVRQLIYSDSYTFKEHDLTQYLQYTKLKKISKDKKLVFMSYANKDKREVGMLCDILENDYNYDVFRAHDKIRIGKDWKEEILKNLDLCDGLVAWVTRNFRMRAWTHQECGYAIAKDVPIFAILIMKSIPGIIEFVQGLPVRKPYDYEDMAKRIDIELSNT